MSANSTSVIDPPIADPTSLPSSLVLLELGAAVISFIERDLPVWLEGFGILFPERSTHVRSRAVEDRLTMRRESRKTIAFERCAELVSYHREKFHGLVETKHLIAHIYPQLPAPVRAQLTERELGRRLVRLIANLKEEVVRTGVSRMLADVGDFYALHNRQGESLVDWYAGSDIFVVPHYRRTTHIEPLQHFERPVLKDAHEPFEAAYGKPIHYFNHTLPSVEGVLHNRIRVAVFSLLPSETGKENHTLIYVTDGVRRESGSDTLSGNELVVQLELTSTERGLGSDMTVPQWPLKMFDAAWKLLQRAPHRILPKGAWIDCNKPLIEESRLNSRSRVSPLTGCLATQCALMRAEQLASDGKYYYASIVGLCAEELEFAQSHPIEDLLVFLRHRKLDQTTRVSRSSVLLRSFFQSPTVTALTAAHDLSEEQTHPHLRASA